MFGHVWDAFGLVARQEHEATYSLNLGALSLPLRLFFLLYTKITVLNFSGQLLAQGQAHSYTASVPGESATQNSDFIND